MAKDHPQNSGLPSPLHYSTQEFCLVLWTGAFESNHDLQQYWMCGIDSPKPRTYHLNLQHTISGRLGRLDCEEAEV